MFHARVVVFLVTAVGVLFAPWVSDGQHTLYEVRCCVAYILLM